MTYLEKLQEEIVEWAEVRERDWIENPLNGLKRYKGQDG